MNLSVLLTNPSKTNLLLAKQAGASEIVLTCPRDCEDPTIPLTESVERVRKHGLNVNVVERFLPHDKIVLGLKGREKQMLYIKRLIECMGKLKIHVLCYNWMVCSLLALSLSLLWVHTRTTHYSPLLIGLEHELISRKEEEVL